MMKINQKLALAAVVLLTGRTALAGSDNDARKGDKPQSSPGWVVLEEDVFYPLRLDAAAILHNADVHYRRGEEKAAANKIKQAISWLKFAAGHGYPETQKQLQAAADDLGNLQVDLRNGNTVAASRMDATLAQAANALAMWHYFKAKDSLAKNELGYAAQDLQAAATYLQSAATSAHAEFGDEIVTLFRDVNHDGVAVDSGVSVEPNRLQSHLDAVKANLENLAKTLAKISHNA
ncbi:MAG: hypothetical protein KDA61_23125 [Planctomycetales bacterium]|nr:hypothetical protein [Planctomycetales bacterium]